MTTMLLGLRRRAIAAVPLLLLVGAVGCTIYLLSVTHQSGLARSPAAQCTIPQLNMLPFSGQREALLISVSTDENDLALLGGAVKDTWLARTPYDTVFFVRGNNATPTKSVDDFFKTLTRTVKADCATSSPQQQLSSQLAVLPALADHYDWFMHITASTYVNVARLQLLLQRWSTAPRKHDDQCYCFHKVDDDNLANGFLIGKQLLKKADLLLASCIAQQHALLPDAFSRCVAVATGKPCVAFSRFVSVSLTQSVSLTNPAADTLDAILLQSRYSPNDLRLFHTKAIEHFRAEHARESLKNGSIKQQQVPIGLASKGQSSLSMTKPESCLNNPMLHMISTGHEVPECPSPERTEPVNLSHLTVLVLSLPGAEKRFKDVQRRFETHGLTPRVFPAVTGIARSDGRLTAGEVGYLNSMKLAFEMALERNLSRILMFDDDAVPSCDFAARFESLLSNADTRCGGYLWSSTGGILLLGSAVWPKKNETTWAPIDEDIERNSAVSVAHGKCFNIRDRALGSFAVLYHRSAFEPMLASMASHQNIPYDHHFELVSRKGLIVRVAYPFLVIPDVRHVSQVNPNRPFNSQLRVRAAKHRWDYSNYCPDKNVTMMQVIKRSVVNK